MANNVISSIKLPKGETIYNLKDNGALQLTSEESQKVTGPVTFDENISVNKINGVTVGNSPKFTDNNTTYTFNDGTNGFTVTPLGGTAQTVKVTPSITNNITGSGTTNKVAKFSDTNTITDGWGVTDNTTATAVTSADTNLITARTLYNAGYTKNVGTVTGIKMNGATKNPTNGVVDLGTVLTSFTESDPTVPSWAKAATKPSYSYDEITGTVPTEALPSYVDDVLEYDTKNDFPTTGEAGKIYVDTSTNLTWRWSGTQYVEISQSLALGELSSTAYRGDRGKVAYDHATDSNRLTTAKTSKLYKIAVTSEGHVSGVTEVIKSDITALGIPAQDTTYTFTANSPTLSWDSESTIGTAGETTYKVKMPANPNTDEKVKLTSVTDNAAYRITLGPTSITSGSTYSENYSTNLTYNPSTKVLTTGGITLTPKATGFTISGGTTTSKTLTVTGDYTLAAASAKGVDTSISSGTTSTNLPTSAAVVAFVEDKGYITEDTNTWRPIQVNGSGFLDSTISTGKLNLKGGGSVTVSGANGTITITGSDTNTHRPIKVNGTQILGDNTTALDLVAGNNNVTISGNDSGTVTISTVNTGTVIHLKRWS